MKETEAQGKFFHDINDIGYHLKHIPMKIRELYHFYQKGQLAFDRVSENRGVA
jgi:hypothetical protein